MAIEVTSQVIEALLKAARKSHPREACGILIGEGNRISAFRETANVHLSPQTHFEIDPQALVDAHRVEREGGPQVLGYFHTHPSGDPIPSATDQAMAAHDGKVWAIIAGRNLRLWRDDPQGFAALSYSVTER
ncbi:MAG: M67 family metallopeptidase [Erythrobacter sp.]